MDTKTDFNAIVSFNFQDFDIKNEDTPDCEDYLQIYQSEPCCFQAMRRCGKFEPFSLTVDGTVITIHFVSDNSNNTKGFNLTWKVNIHNTSVVSTTFKWTSKIQSKSSAKIISTTGLKKLGTTDPEKSTSKTKNITRTSSQIATHKLNTFVSMTDTTRMIGALEPTEFTTQQQNSITDDLAIKIQRDEITYLVAGIGVVELTLIVLMIMIYIKRQRRSNSIGQNANDENYPVSRKSVASVGNVYESIPLEHFLIEDSMPEEDEVYIEVPEHMYDKTFEHRPRVNVNPNLYHLKSDLKSKNI